MLLFLARLSAQTVITDTTAGPGTWLCPAGVTSVHVECWGGGGGGGFAKYQYTAAGSGAGGSYINYTMPVTPGTTYYIYVGAGGSGGKDSITPGGTGGSSYFGSTTDTLPLNAVVLAVGGIGGNSVDSLGAKGAPHSATGGQPFQVEIYRWLALQQVYMVQQMVLQLQQVRPLVGQVQMEVLEVLPVQILLPLKKVIMGLPPAAVVVVQ